MPVISIALMGFFAFGGGSMTLPGSENLSGTPVAEDVASTTLALADAPSMLFMAPSTHVVHLTSYNAVPEQTDDNPTVTASGAYTNPEIVAARSVDLADDLPFGTVVAITRGDSDSSTCHFGKVEHLIGYRVIADSMHSRKREQIDVLLDQHDTVIVDGKETNPSLALGVCGNVTVSVLGKIAVADMPETQEELRRMVEGDALAYGI